MGIPSFVTLVKLRITPIRPLKNTAALQYIQNFTKHIEQNMSNVFFCYNEHGCENVKIVKTNTDVKMWKLLKRTRMWKWENC